MMKRLLRTGLAAALAIAALYLTVRPHEVGHATAAFLLGCKPNWWSTDTSWYLWSSWGGNVDYECLHAKGAGAVAAEEFAGIGVNLILLGLCPILGNWRQFQPSGQSAWRRWVLVGTVWWALANYAEAFSYLVVNTAWLRSDMRAVVLGTGVNRWLWFAAGLVSAVVIGSALRKPVRAAGAVIMDPSPAGWPVIVTFILYTLVSGGVMAAARVLLTQ
jgi:hypothetical protein